MRRLTMYGVVVVTVVLGCVAANGQDPGYVSVKMWGSLGTGPGQFQSPHSLTVFGERVYVGDLLNQRVQVFDLNGTAIEQWTHFTNEVTGAPEHLGNTSPINHDSEGNIYVGSGQTPTGPSSLVKFSPSGATLHVLRDISQYPGIPGVSIDADGFIYHGYSAGTYPNDGIAVYKIDQQGVRQGDFTSPTTIGGRSAAVDSAGFVYVSQLYDHRVMKLKPTGALDGYIGTPGAGPYGTGPGQFWAPYFAKIDPSGHLWVADYSACHVQKFTTTGDLLACVGEPGAGPGQLAEPTDMDVDAAGNLYVVEAANHRVQKFRPPNRPPLADAGPDQTVEADAVGGANVTLDGSGSSDPDEDPLAFTWTWTDADGNPQTVTGESRTVFLPLGQTTVTLVVSDGALDSEPDDALIAVQDTTPPSIVDLTADPALLWPPNHKMRSITLTYALTDIADDDASAAITSVTCNEASFQSGDYEIVDATHLKLRAEREGGNQAGRIYTVEVTGTDASGNTVTATTVVTVPHDMRGGSEGIASASAVPTPVGAQIILVLRGEADVSATVLNLAGRPIRTLCTAKALSAGTSTLLWNAQSDMGLRVPSGVYLIRLTARSAEGGSSTALTTVRLIR